MSNSTYYIAINSSQEGPFTIDELKSKYQKNIISTDNLIWNNSFGNQWKPINTVLEVFKRINSNEIQNDKVNRIDKNNINTKINNKNMKIEPLNTNGWMSKVTTDGANYYYNCKLDIISFDNPDEKIENKSQEYFWYKHEYYSWTPVRLIGEVDNKNKYSLVDYPSETIEVKIPSQNIIPISLRILNHLEWDIVLLDEIHEAPVLYNIRKRYLNDEIYTWVGANHSVLISVNPYKSIPIYGIKQINDHSHPPLNKPILPHVFDVIYQSYNDLILLKKAQSILISGESGSGKTECTKQCLQFLAEIAGSELNIEQKILEANPVLEAFGNAKTVRNDNSSRFGKYIQIYFNNKGEITGSKITNYLLEKSRLVFQQNGERNFHIFYQLLSDREMVEKYDLKAIETYHYLNQSSCYFIDNVSDENEFANVKHAFDILEFTKEEKDNIINLLIAILNLGNIQFKYKEINGSEGCEITDTALLHFIASSLNISVLELDKWLTHKLFIPPKGEEILMNLNVKNADENRDALAKNLYDKLFNYIVMKINKSINKTGITYNDNSSIGILDIFGFEIFEKNSFEQLCINYTNEKLQQQFNFTTFTEEENVYMSEKIQYTSVPFISNQDVLNLIENREGLFFYLDEMKRVPGGNNSKYLAQILNKQSKVLRQGSSQNSFMLIHYAGKVNYSVEDFMEKNTDTMLPKLFEMLSFSDNKFISTLFPNSEKNNLRDSISKSFTIQIQKLMAILKATKSRYIRCIKPNQNKLPNTFDVDFCLEQLRYSGVFEAVKIRKTGYPYRLTHDQFVQRYQLLMLDHNHKIIFKSQKSIERCKEIISKRKEITDQIQIGQTLCLYRSEQHRILELARNLVLEKFMPKLQAIVRSYLIKKNYAKMKKEKEKSRQLLQKLHAVMEEKNINKLSSTLAECETFFSTFKLPLVTEGYELLSDLQYWDNITQKILKIISKEDINFELLSPLLNELTNNKHKPHNSSQEEIFIKGGEALIKCVASRIEPQAEIAIYNLDKNEMIKVLELSNEYNHLSDNINKIKYFLSLSEEEFMKEELKNAVVLHDPIRRHNRELFLEMKKIMKELDYHHFQDYPNFRIPQEFAKASYNIFKRKYLIASMKSYMDCGIPSSLTNIKDPVLIKQSILIFKCIRGYMGEKKVLYPNQSVVDILEICINVPQLRNETYCQLFKQLSNNPNKESLKKGYDLLSILCQIVAPMSDFLPYYYTFIIQNNLSHNYISYMHELIIEESGCVRALPKLDVIQLLLEKFQTEYRSRYSVDMSTTPINVMKGIALFNFNPVHENTIHLISGEEVVILSSGDENWYKVKTQSGEGYVPKSYIKLI